MTTPVVALVGRPNVGKSTLFNRLTRTRDALVADFPGLTRDRKYGHANISGYDFIVIDTGGIDGTEEGVEEKMAEQSLLAIEEADVVLFLVDARAGLTAADIGIANYLRQRTNKTTVVVANKTDGIDADSHCAEFYQLGLGEIEQIAASQGRGVTQLMEQVLAPLAEKLQENEAENNRTSDEEEKDEKESLFYTNITLDGRFITIGENNWDLRSRHKFDEVHIDMNDIYTDEDEESEEVEDDVDSTIEDDYNN